MGGRKRKRDTRKREKREDKRERTPPNANSWIRPGSASSTVYNTPFRQSLTHIGFNFLVYKRRREQVETSARITGGQIREI